jgi:hypothetical protein
MKTTIATSELFGWNPEGTPKRLTIAVGAPTQQGDGTGWQCRVAVADLVRPTEMSGSDSFAALAAAVSAVRAELTRLQGDGWWFASDSAGRERIDVRDWPPARTICHTADSHGGRS